MKTFPFRLNPEVNLIVIYVAVNGFRLKFALDTGASHTVMDKTAFILSDGSLSDSRPGIVFETASGKINGEAATLDVFEALGVRRAAQDIYVYDFFYATGLVTHIDGLPGLDFFAGKKLCIDFVKSEISLS